MNGSSAIFIFHLRIPMRVHCRRSFWPADEYCGSYSSALTAHGFASVNGEAFIARSAQAAFSSPVPCPCGALPVAPSTLLCPGTINASAIDRPFGIVRLKLIRFALYDVNMIG
jgi:hypothetical protein